MKACQYCKKELPDTALRCRYCRKTLKAAAPRAILPGRLRKIAAINLEQGFPPWALKEVLVLWLFAFAASLSLVRCEITSMLMEALRRRYFIFIKEPALQIHLYIFIGTFTLKLLAVAAVWIILRLHRTGFAAGLKLTTPFKKEWLWIFPAFFIFSVISRLLAGADPLSPNLPVYMFFRESSIIAVIFTLFSIFIVAPVSEEIFFRGFIYPAINKRLGLFWAVLMTSAMFAAVHAPQCREYPYVLFIIFLGGIILTTARALSGSTLLAILLHALYNMTITLVGYIKFLIAGY
jgi:membrane protease YdiL (CAAX protease family)